MVEKHEELELKFGEWAHEEHVVACSSGTAALHLALEALRLPPGGEVILPDFTMVACARAVTLAGLTPVFVDCKPDLTVDTKFLWNALTRRTCAVMAVHVYGRLCDMLEVHRFAARAGIPIVEDCAESHGAFHEVPTAARCWSFYRNKIVAGEEGGAVAFADRKDAELARKLRCLGFTEKHDYDHMPRGHNYRLAPSLASLVLQSLESVDSELVRRLESEAELNSMCPVANRMPFRDAPWVYDMLVDEPDRAVETLNAAGIAARRAFKPMSSQEEYSRYRRFGIGRAYAASRSVLYLPFGCDAAKAFDLLAPFLQLRG